MNKLTQTEKQWRVNCETEVTSLRSRVDKLEAENKELRSLWIETESSFVRLQGIADRTVRMLERLTKKQDGRKKKK